MFLLNFNLKEFIYLLKVSVSKINSLHKGKMVLTGADKVDMKVVLLGKEFGGKTSLVERYLRNYFTGNVPYQATIGAAYGAKKVEVHGRTVVLGVWDTAGSERYESMSRIYYRGAKAAIICYDLTDSKSYERAVQWTKEIRELEEGCALYLCGTKKDLIAGDSRLNQQVDYHNVRDFADEINAQVFETSSKTGENISELFYKIAEDYAKNEKNFTPAEDPQRIHVASEDSRSRPTCGCT